MVNAMATPNSKELQVRCQFIKEMESGKDNGWDQEDSCPAGSNFHR